MMYGTHLLILVYLSQIPASIIHILYKYCTRQFSDMFVVFDVWCDGFDAWFDVFDAWFDVFDVVATHIRKLNSSASLYALAIIVALWNFDPKQIIFWLENLSKNITFSAVWVYIWYNSLTVRHIKPMPNLIIGTRTYICSQVMNQVRLPKQIVLEPKQM